VNTLSVASLSASDLPFELCAARNKGIREILASAELYLRVSVRLFGGILNRGRIERVDRARLYPDPSAGVQLCGDGSRVG